MERPVRTDLTDRYKLEFAGSSEPKTVRIQNSHASTDGYISFRADDGSTVPDETDYDVVAPAGGEPIELKDFSMKVCITSYLANISIFRY
jgi:hypothetical protein